MDSDGGGRGNKRTVLYTMVRGDTREVAEIMKCLLYQMMGDEETNQNANVWPRSGV